MKTPPRCAFLIRYLRLLLLVVVCVSLAVYIYAQRDNLFTRIQPPVQGVVGTLNLDSSGGGSQYFNTVGIGTTSPGSPLHVVGSPILQGNQNAIQWKDSAGNLKFLTGLRNDVDPDLDYVFYSYGGNWIFNSGNVGIGTASPSDGRVVAVQSGSSVFSARSATDAVADGVANVTSLRSVDLDTSHWANARYDAYSHAWGYGGSATANTAMTINGSGSVGIGTTTPGSKLDVVGLIRNSAPSQGTLELSGLLPGYADNTYPTLKTSGSTIYFSTSGAYTGYIQNAGPYFRTYYDYDDANYYVNPAGVSVTNDMRANIFYDQANTGYYVDPASTTNLNTVQGVDFYAGSWFRNVGVTGIYNSTYDNHFYSNSTNYWVSASDNGMQFRINHESTLRGYVYHDTSGFGLLNDNGSWAVQIPLSQGASPWPRMRAFYDLDDISYYVNPAGTTNLSTLNINGYAINSPLTSYGTIALTTAKGSYYGVLLGYGSSHANFMWDGGGNGGIYYEDIGRWATYYLKGSNHLQINTSSDLGYQLGVSGTLGATSTIYSSAGGQYGYGTLCFGDTRNWGVRKCLHGGESTDAIDFLTENGGAWVGTKMSYAWQASDIRLKKNIEPIPNALNIVNQLQGRSYEWRQISADSATKGRQFGFIAQEVEKVIPQIVTSGKDGTKGIIYDSIIPFTVESIKEINSVVNVSDATNLKSPAIKIDASGISHIIGIIVEKIQATVVETKRLIVSGVDVLERLNALTRENQDQQKEIEVLKLQIQQLNAK